MKLKIDLKSDVNTYLMLLWGLLTLGLLIGRFTQLGWWVFLPAFIIALLFWITENVSINSKRVTKLNTKRRAK